MWIEKDGDWELFIDHGVLLEVVKDASGRWSWTAYVQHGEDAPWEMHDHGRAYSEEGAKKDAEGSLEGRGDNDGDDGDDDDGDDYDDYDDYDDGDGDDYDDVDDYDDGDDYDGDHGTALMSAGYGDESFGYECGEWL